MATVERGQKVAERNRLALALAQEGKLSYDQIGERIGASGSTVHRILKDQGFVRPKGQPRALKPSRVTSDGKVLVTNAPLREAVEACGMTLTEIAVAIGYTQNREGRGGNKDTTRLRRALGNSPTHGSWRADGTRATYYQVSIPIEFAERVCEAIGLDFDTFYADHIPEKKPAARCKQCGAEMRTASRDKLCGLCLEERNPVPSALAEELAAWKLDEQVAA